MTEWPLTPEELEKMIDDDFIERAKGMGPMGWEGYAKYLKPNLPDQIGA